MNSTIKCPCGHKFGLHRFTDERDGFPYIVIQCDDVNEDGSECTCTWYRQQYTEKVIPELA